MRRAVTLADVARLAGVSVATASKALNSRDRVSATTRERVILAARSLSFTHNSLARGLSRGQSGTVGLLTSDLAGRFSLPILMGAEDAFGADQVSVFLCVSRGDAIREQYHLSALSGRRVDGILVVGSYTDPRPSLGRDFPVPLVYVYAPSIDPADVSLTPDNVGAARLAVEHLLSTGRTKIAHITGVAHEQAAIDRARGVREALDGTRARLVFETGYGEWEERWGRSAVALMLAETIDVDAVLCDSDLIARGAIDGLRERGIAIPADIAVMGFGNWGTVVAGAQPQLSTVDMNLERLGRLAAERLSAAIEGKAGEGGVEYQATRLVVRGSTLNDH